MTPPDDLLTSAALGRIRSSGLKITPQRLAIVLELERDPCHPTAQELYDRLRPVLPGMSFATVYNTLDTLAERGLCSALALAPGPTRFDANMSPHDHIVCDGCGLVRDVHRAGNAVPASEDGKRRDAKRPDDQGRGGQRPDDQGGDATKGSAAAVDGFVVRTVEQIYRGLCAACAAEGLPPHA